MSIYTILGQVRIWQPPSLGAIRPDVTIRATPATAVVLKNRGMSYTIADGELQVWMRTDDPCGPSALPGSPGRLVFYLSEIFAGSRAVFPATASSRLAHTGYYFSNLGASSSCPGEATPARLPFMGDTAFLKVAAARDFTVDIFTWNAATGNLDRPVLTGLEMHLPEALTRISIPLDWLPLGKYRLVVNDAEQLLYHDPLAASQEAWGVAEIFQPLRKESLFLHAEALPQPVFA